MNPSHWLPWPWCISWPPTDHSPRPSDPLTLGVSGSFLSPPSSLYTPFFSCYFPHRIGLTPSPHLFSLSCYISAVSPSCSASAPHQAMITCLRHPTWAVRCPKSPSASRIPPAHDIPPSAANRHYQDQIHCASHKTVSSHIFIYSRSTYEPPPLGKSLLGAG